MTEMRSHKEDLGNWRSKGDSVKPSAGDGDGNRWLTVFSGRLRLRRFALSAARLIMRDSVLTC